MSVLNVTWAYPDFLSLHGDRGNVMALERVGRLLGVDVHLRRVDELSDALDLEDTDLLVLNAGQWDDLARVSQCLSTAGISEYVDNGGSVFASGTTWAVLGRSLTGLDASEAPGTGLSDFETFQHTPIYGDDLVVSVSSQLEFIGGQRLVGSQIAVSYALGPADQALGVSTYGRANGDVEGSRVGLGGVAKAGSLEGVALGCRPGESGGCVIGTNLLGPVLAKNPWFAQGIIQLALSRRGRSLPAVDTDLDAELSNYMQVMGASADTIADFNDQKFSLKAKD
ncbi:MAG: hypothetical protein Q4P06_02645 [Actinomycetaceae bacterium]|nr:hypothetical protein [Actinomycetaceae bacterium]